MAPKDKPMKDGTDHLGKAICPHCHGNGYIKVKDRDWETLQLFLK